jgi:hypothetical protein
MQCPLSSVPVRGLIYGKFCSMKILEEGTWNCSEVAKLAASVTGVFSEAETTIASKSECQNTYERQPANIMSSVFQQQKVKKPVFIYLFICYTRWRSWLRHCTTNLKVAGSIPDDVIGTFLWHNLSGCTMTLGLTQPLTVKNTRNIS